MKKIFVKKINYKIFAKHNKFVILLTVARILFYLNITAGFVALAYFSGENKQYRSILTAIWIATLLITTISSFYLSRKLEKCEA